MFTKPSPVRRPNPLVTEPISKKGGDNRTARSLRVVRLGHHVDLHNEGRDELHYRA